MSNSKSLFIILFLTVLTASLSVSVAAPYLTVYWNGFIESGVGIAIIMSAYSFAKIIAGPLGGKISSKTGISILIKSGSMLCLLSSAVYVFLPSETIFLVIAQISCGFGIGLIRPLSIALLCINSKNGSSGKVLGIFEISFYLSLIIGPVLGGILYEFFGMKVLLQAILILNSLCFLASLFIPKNFNMNENRYISTPAVYNKEIVNLIFYMFTRAFGIAAIAVFLPILLSVKYNASGMIIGGMLAEISLVSAVSLPFLGHITDRFDRSSCLVYSSSVVSLLTISIPFADSISMLFILGTLIGIFAAFTKVASMTLLAESCIKYELPWYLGIFNTGMNLGFLCSVFIGGIMSKYYGETDIIFYLYGMLGLVGTVVFFMGTMAQSIRQDSKTYSFP